MGAKRKKKNKKHKISKNFSQKAPRISVCMIVKDEEKFLPHCLKSIKDIADEIIIVDTGSTDRSIEIAKSFGAKVYLHPWENDFAKHRNQSLSYATGDWIFLIDADEVVPQQEIENLRSAVLNPVADAYRLTTRNYKPSANQINTQQTRGDYPEEKGYQYWVPSTKIRLFRRNPDISFEGAVHELVEPSINRLGLKIADLSVPILHFGDIEKQRDEARYLQSAKDKVKRFPHSPKAFYELALIQANSNMVSEALSSIERAIELFREGREDPYLDPPKLFLLKGNILMAQGRHGEAIVELKQALDLAPRLYEAMNNIGICFEYTGDFDSSEHWFKKALSICKDSPLLHKNLERIAKKKQNQNLLSVCMIVKNEAQNIERAIRSVLSFADEVVVVDTGSTDETVEIAKSLGAKIGHFGWCDDFSAARNASLEMANGHWIMWLDADDYIPPTQWRTIQDLKLLEPTQAFMFKLKSIGAENTISWQVRMFPRNRDIRFSYPVHEQITPSIISLQIPIKKAEVTIIHTGYSDLETIKSKRQRNLQILEKALAKDPSDSMVRFHLGYSYFSMGMYEQAEIHFRRVIEDKEFKERFTGGYTAALTFLGRIYLMTNQNKRALEVLDEALRLDNRSQLSRVYLASSYNRLGEPKKALELLDMDTADAGISIVPVDTTHLEYLWHLEKALALEKLGHFEQALFFCSHARRLSPHLKDAKDVYYRVHKKISELPQAPVILKQICKSEHASSEDLYFYGISLTKHGQVSEAENAFRLAVEKDEKHIKARRSLAAILRHRSFYEEAKQVLLQGLRLHPGDKDLINDLTETLFMLEDWETIIEVATCDEALPTRLAARLISGIDHGMEKDIVALFRLHDWDLEELDRNGVAALWGLAETLHDPARFHLAVACFWLQPSLKQAAGTAAKGYLARGRPEKAFQIAEQSLSAHSEDPDMLKLAAQCLEKMGKVEELVNNKPIYMC